MYECKKRLYFLIDRYGLNSDEVLTCSRELDIIINNQMKNKQK